MVIKAKPVATATSAKRSHLLKVFGKVSGAFRRHLGELSRTRMNATSAERELGKANIDIERVLTENLAATGLPVVGVDAPIPAGAHWLIVPLASQRNALYARDGVCSAVVFVDKDGTCPIGAIFFPLEDMCMIAEATHGVIAEPIGRLRCANRLELNDTLAMLPWKTVDVVEMGLLKMLDGENIHTRKSGNTLSDLFDVACGRADFAIATRVNRLESYMANLVMAESAGFASDLKGKPLGPTSTTLIAANPKLHAKVVKLLA
ncbi:MAG: hypothetical protein EON60_04585 [Alphaproteobacteria bacterium]|nr:MAG: hypothetical protein EON60_04585 [Alphaproteobacteria bacterium]